jgi:hypothetical protein
MKKGIENAAVTILTALILRKAIRETPATNAVDRKAGALIVAEATNQVRKLFSFDNMMAAADRGFDKFLAH